MFVRRIRRIAERAEGFGGGECGAGNSKNIKESEKIIAQKSP